MFYYLTVRGKFVFLIGVSETHILIYESMGLNVHNTF